MKCGFIGLGSQGAPMARRMIDAGHDVTLWARRPESLAPYADTNAKTASSIAELGGQVEHVGVCVLDDAGVRDVCGALIPAMRAGSRIAIHSTVNPQTCVDLAQQAAVRGIALIDAPVSGGEPAAKAGALTVMVGGDKDAVEAARPIFETFGRLIVHLGGVGAGQRAKLINNTMMAAHMEIARHALDAAAKLDIDRPALVELIKASSGRSFGFEIFSRGSPEGLRMGGLLLAKDARLLGELMGDEPSANALRAVAAPYFQFIGVDQPKPS